MADVFSKAKRSAVMARIRSRGNEATEMALARLLRRHGLTGWRRQRKLMVKKLMVDSGRRPGSASPQRGEGVRRRNHQPSTDNYQLAVRPDFVFLKQRTAVFVDGCFWHGCPRHATQPRSNRAFWRQKFLRNKKRDALVTRTLRRAFWRVLRVWEHELAEIKKTSTPRPGPLPVRGGEGAEARLVRRIQQALL